MSSIISVVRGDGVVIGLSACERPVIARPSALPAARVVPWISTPGLLRLAVCRIYLVGDSTPTISGILFAISSNLPASRQHDSIRICLSEAKLPAMHTRSLPQGCSFTSHPGVSYMLPQNRCYLQCPRIEPV